jgi:hypothetical protein
MALPDCDTLFSKYFLPWFGEQDRKRRVFQATRPDVEQLEVPDDMTASDVSPLTAEGRSEAASRIADMLEAATVDWKEFLPVGDAPSTTWVAEFDRHFQRPRIQEVLKRSVATRFDNDYLVLCCELGAVLGTVLRALEPQLCWLYDWPYWESGLYCQKTRMRINVFHWAVKKLSEYGVEDELAAKIAACQRGLHSEA